MRIKSDSRRDKTRSGHKTQSEAKFLGVIIDNDLNLREHIDCITKTEKCCESQTISSSSWCKEIDSCAGVLSSGVLQCSFNWITQKSVNILHLIQNTAARDLTNTSKREHVTPIVASLHWLSVYFRIDFKIPLRVYKALNDLAPQHLPDCLSLYTPSRCLGYQTIQH